MKQMWMSSQAAGIVSIQSTNFIFTSQWWEHWALTPFTLFFKDFLFTIFLRMQGKQAHKSFNRLNTQTVIAPCFSIEPLSPKRRKGTKWGVRRKGTMDGGGKGNWMPRQKTHSPKTQVHVHTEGRSLHWWMRKALEQESLAQKSCIQGHKGAVQERRSKTAEG